MAKEEIKFTTEMFEFKVGETVEGVLKEAKDDVGVHKNTIYTLQTTENGDISFWGAKALSPLLDQIEIGKKVYITLVEENHKFPNGRVGRLFRVEKEV